MVTDAVTDDGSRRPRIRRVHFVVLVGPDKDKRFAARGTRATIGIQDSADVVLTDPSVSRFHCEIELRDDRIAIRDLGSTNGTFVNGVRVVDAFLGDADVLTLGRTRLRVDFGADHVEVPMSERERFATLVGRSPAMRAVFALLERAAASDSTVLLEGDTGTGKELAAQAIHSESARRDQPFVALDCGAIPPTLLESELFGHDKGAFTGAVSDRRGAFESAHGGTVFLDEIGELTTDLQPKLLRVLERREVRPLGSNRVVSVDVRIVAATNRNLRGEVNSGRFRADLFYRLAVLEIRMPALREHVEDLPLLVEDILLALGAAGSREADRIRAPAFLDELGRHPWPGNVRELRNHVERCLALHPIGPVALAQPHGPPALDASRPFRAARDDFERAYFEDLLRRHAGNVSAAARAAGMDRPTLYRALWKHGLR
jgi:two-component system, NtrC family, response regulator GlrR